MVLARLYRQAVTTYIHTRLLDIYSYMVKNISKRLRGIIRLKFKFCFEKSLAKFDLVLFPFFHLYFCCVVRNSTFECTWSLLLYMCS